MLYILKKQLEQLNTKGHEVLVVGDLNENLLKYNEDKQTSEYLDMLVTLGFMPIITKPTRITDHTATLIDHIYTNTPEKLMKSGLCLADISDHLPIFCTIANTLPTVSFRVPINTAYYDIFLCSACQLYPA